MKIVVVHNEYRTPGGEDVVVAQEVALLQKHGHEVLEYRRSNRELDELRFRDKLSLPKRVIWAGSEIGPLEQLLRQTRPDLVHVHNTFMMISPRVHHLCKAFGLPVVQTLHNYRLLCPRADFFRFDRVCEECLGKSLPWPAIAYGCYRRSRAQSGVVAALLATHRWLGTWARNVDLFIAPTEFARQKFIQGGLPEEKLVVKPNFLMPDPGESPGDGKYAIFVGRFSPEKGVDTLLDAWGMTPGIELKMVGGNGLAAIAGRARRNQGALSGVERVGWRSRAEVLELIKGALFLVFPSEWFETFGLVIIEAFASGIPVVASRLGCMMEIVKEGETGLLFSPGDAIDLAAKVRWAMDHPGKLRSMGKNARQEFERKYTEGQNYDELMAIYDRAMEENSRARYA
ncbi:MAG: glycosyltransferase family 4 protein [Bacteroidota bacterium]